MRIQHNIAALNTHRALGANQSASAKNLEKLSSGYAINRAGDDAAGLAISEKMRGQISGLNMASKNSQDGISLIQTAEGALNETHSILQRMRELAVQAGNDTNTDSDRGQLQKEMDQLSSEINRIGNTTEFNTKKLVNGDLSAEKVVTKGATGTTVSKDFAKTQDQIVGSNPTTWSTPASPQLKDKTEVTISGTAANGLEWNTLDTDETNQIIVQKDATTQQMKVTVNAVDSNSKTLNIDSQVMSYDDTTKTYNFDQDGVKLSLTADQVNSWTAGESATVDLNRGAAAGGTIDATATPKIDLASKVNPLGAATGGAAPSATVSNFHVDGTSKEALPGVSQAVISYTGGKLTVDLQDSTNTSVSKSEYSLTAGNATPFSYNENGISFDISLAAGTTDLAATTVKLDTESRNTTVGATSDVTEDKSLKFQIGANESQSISVSIGDMRAEKLGITSKDGGAGFKADKTVTDGTNATNEEYSLDISNHENAGNAIKVIDNAIEKVSTQRSQLGAVQNRLEHTINNLGTTSENLTAAESRIRDTDMAKEMMAFTKNNILTQAAQSMLAQANQQPQGVLSLLQ